VPFLAEFVKVATKVIFPVLVSVIETFPVKRSASPETKTISLYLVSPTFWVAASPDTPGSKGIA